MIILNFGHPLTRQQVDQVEKISGQKALEIIYVPIHFDSDQPFLYQIKQLMGKIPLSSEALQTQPIIVNLPSLNSIAALLLADLHGRMGYFPPVLRLRPIVDGKTSHYEVTEIINLQAVRNAARETRYED